jgi:SAM-dependent methyltransferase
MPLSVNEWHQRFLVQSQWTAEARHHLYSLAKISSSQRLLDVGCGSGVLSKELTQITGSRVSGIDIDHEILNIALQYSPNADFVEADANQIPFRANSFSCSFCHFVLLWLGNPLHVISEMKRVTQPGGTLLFLAEPDFGGRIDYPEQFSILGEWQVAALRSQGANPFLGRQLSSLLHASGLKEIQVGVIGAQWIDQPSEQSISSEWEVIRSDLEEIKNLSEAVEISESMFKADLNAWARGERVLYVPTFYAIGKVID